MLFQIKEGIIFSDMKMFDVINKNPYLMLMIEHFGINLIVHEKTIAQVCAEKNISPDLFIAFTGFFNGNIPSSKYEYSFSDIQVIIDYLKNCHQYYQNEKYPQIKFYIEKISQINKKSEIKMLEKFFEEYYREVTEHLDYENTVVFPYIENLSNVLQRKYSENISINYSVTEYKEHHNDIEEKLNDLKNLLIKYLPQNHDQQIRRQLLFSLFELEHDLNIHSQIEDKILIPLVEKMESLVGNAHE